MSDQQSGFLLSDIPATLLAATAADPPSAASALQGPGCSAGDASLAPAPDSYVPPIHRLRDDLTRGAALGYSALHTVLPAATLCRVVEEAFQLFKKEPTLVELVVHDPHVEVIVVGDTHGQFHDLCKLLELVGMPSAKRIYIFNGDFVDRGAWGVELMAMLLSLKLACPTWVYLLRGNHESSNCTLTYGFKAEVDTKYSPTPCAHKAEEVPEGVAPTVSRPSADAKAVYKAFKKMFSVLPLAALVQNKTLVVHGGLFRRPPPVRKPGNKRGGAYRKAQLVPEHYVELGSLDDLRAASKGGMDPAGDVVSTVVAADIMWSDPVKELGMQFNESRGVGLTFGPDITQRFLESNGLSLIIRSHEGPDARSMRTDMPQVTEGYALDHVTEAGKLVTVFSAPDYPQFQDGDTRYNNKGAVAVLTAPDYCLPEFKSFEACLPRPQALAFYNFLFTETDDEASADEGHTEASCSAGGSASVGGAAVSQQEATGDAAQSHEQVASTAEQALPLDVVGHGSKELPSPGVHAPQAGPEAARAREGMPSPTAPMVVDVAGMGGDKAAEQGESQGAITAASGAWDGSGGPAQFIFAHESCGVEMPLPVESCGTAMPPPFEGCSAAVPPPMEGCSAAVPPPMEGCSVAVPPSMEGCSAAVPPPMEGYSAAVRPPMEGCSVAMPPPIEDCSAAVPQPLAGCSVAVPPSMEGCSIAVPMESYSAQVLPSMESCGGETFVHQVAGHAQDASQEHKRQRTPPDGSPGSGQGNAKRSRADGGKELGHSQTAGGGLVVGSADAASVGGM